MRVIWQLNWTFNLGVLYIINTSSRGLRHYNKVSTISKEAKSYHGIKGYKEIKKENQTDDDLFSYANQ
jgi:hypothetical protein